MDQHMVVVGMGYVGIPCAALFADRDGFHVTGVQRRSPRSGWKIDCLNSGQSPFDGHEPGLDELIERVVRKGRFHVVDDYEACETADYILIDVQTPTEADRTPRYESLREVSLTIGERMKRGVLVIIESTVAPGTTENVALPLLERASGMKAGRDFGLAFSYERVMPGRLIEFFVDLPRIVGGIDPESTRRAVELYRHIVRQEVVGTSCRTAEMAKTIENSFRDLNIAFANEMALMCESMGVDVWEVRDLVNSRADRQMHKPGAGVGGHCLPKDPYLLVYGATEWGTWPPSATLVMAARETNDRMPLHMAALVREGLKRKGLPLMDARIAVLGLAYLENCDDTRNTPAVPLVRELTNNGASVIVHDPYVHRYTDAPLELTADLDAALRGADCAALVTAHQEYAAMDPRWLAEVMRTPVLIDGRRVTDRAAYEAAGVLRIGLGEPRP
jgi:UDP-N-acetyl-D-mannosaminuronic acid dehydrogenase